MEVEIIFWNNYLLLFIAYSISFSEQIYKKNLNTVIYSKVAVFFFFGFVN